MRTQTIALLLHVIGEIKNLSQTVLAFGPPKVGSSDKNSKGEEGLMGVFEVAKPT